MNITEDKVEKLDDKMDTLETQMAKLEKDVEYLGKDLKGVKSEVHDINHKTDAIHSRLDEFRDDLHNNFVNKKEFLYWRNLFVGGMLVTIFLAIVLGIITKLIN